MIDKVIHYCWFGNNPKSDLINKCIESWKKYCPEYKIIEWNEHNFDINMCEFTKNAYKTKKYAFVSDVARIWAIYNYGGVYLDTDVELYKSLDELLNYEAFFCIDNGRSINTGSGCGAETNHIAMKILLDDYRNQYFELDRENNLVCSYLNTIVLQSKYPKFEKMDKTQVIDNIIFLSSSDMNIISKHHGERSWLEDFDKSMVKHHGRMKMSILMKLRNPKIFEFIVKYFGTKGEKIYEFLVYDFFDLKISYFIKKFIKKYI